MEMAEGERTRVDLNLNLTCLGIFTFADNLLDSYHCEAENALLIRLRRGMASSPAGLRARPKSFSEKFCSCILPLLKGASSFSRFEDDEPSHEFKERMARASNAMKVSEETKSRMDDEKRKAVEVVPVPLPPSERSSAKSYDTASKLAALQK
jgi:hypothetical protein